VAKRQLAASRRAFLLPEHGRARVLRELRLPEPFGRRDTFFAEPLSQQVAKSRIELQELIDEVIVIIQGHELESGSPWTVTITGSLWQRRPYLLKWALALLSDITFMSSKLLSLNQQDVPPF
jgi:hypothetical protein